jgi:hypothetical protein
VLYLLEVDGMVAAFAAGFIFIVSGLLTVILLAWREAKALVAGQYRIYKRRVSLLTEPQLLASPLATPSIFLSKEKR